MTINLFSIEILVGLITGLFLGALIKNFFKKKETNDDFGKNIIELKTEVENYRKEDLKKQGSFEEALRNSQTDRQSFVDTAKELQQTLVSGGGQQQGAWGEMTLRYILIEKLGFTEGEEFHVHVARLFFGNRNKVCPRRVRLCS